MIVTAVPDVNERPALTTLISTSAGTLPLRSIDPATNEMWRRATFRRQRWIR